MDLRVTSAPRLLPPSVTPPAPGVPPAGAGVPPLGVPPVDGIPGVAPGGHRPGSPLERSGIDLQALLATEDQLASREAVQGGELEVGLEQARGALVRRAPHETMAILDQVWDGAQRSEEGWYLRAGALVGLGLDEDGDRVAGDGLTQRPDSTALRYARSLARLGTGDVGGARVALEEALALRPQEPLLSLQHALVRARRGTPAVPRWTSTPWRHATPITPPWAMRGTRWGAWRLRRAALPRGWRCRRPSPPPLPRPLPRPPPRRR